MSPGAGKEGSGRPAEEAPAEPEKRKPGWLRENLEAIAVAIVLALLIRQYALEAFVIPTGSMAPTLLGAHVDVECTNCGKRQPISESCYQRHRTAARAAEGNAQGRCPKCGKFHRATLLEDAFVSGRAEIRCDRCEAIVPMTAIQEPKGDGDRLITAYCSNCRAEFENRVETGYWPFGDLSRGDRILVDKFIYHFQKPRRYEVAVFKFPKRPEDNFIKRLIGLPDETIDVRDGDIYVQGKIARKPDGVQEELWRPVNEARYVEKDGGGARGPAWRAEGGTWTPAGEGRAWRGEAGGDPGTGTGSGTGAGTGAATETGWLVYNRDIRDWNPYNEAVHAGGHNIVGDVRLRVRAEAGSESVRVLARITVDEQAIEAEVGRASAALRWRGQELKREALEPARERTIDLARVDAAIVFKIDGRELARFQLDDSNPKAETRRSEVRIGVRGGAATFRDLAAYRDVYYLASIPGASRTTFPFHVPPDRYFFLGDNSSNSTDGREWGTVPAGYLVGRAFLVFWPAVPGDFAVRRIR